MRNLKTHNIFLGMALYGCAVFGSASTVSALAASSSMNAGSQNGIWVKLCATGGLTFISFDGENEDNTPAPTSHAQACHASDRRLVGDTGVDTDGVDEG